MDQLAHPFSVSDRICVLGEQLFLLREALIRTSCEAVYSPDLIRALRVLVVDRKGLLLDMAEHLNVQHDVIASRAIRPPSKRRAAHAGDLILEGVSVVMDVDPASRWRAVRGLAQPRAKQGYSVSFSEYLDRPVAVDYLRGFEVSRKQLIADYANEMFGVHNSKAYSPHLRFATEELDGGPYFLIVSQETAFEALDFGQKVLDEAVQSLSGKLNRRRWIVPSCHRCGAVMHLTKFLCSLCGASHVPPARPSRRDLFQSLLDMYANEGTREGAVSVIVVPAAALPLPPDTPVCVARTHRDGFETAFVLGPSGHLEWRVNRRGQHLKTSVDLSGHPILAGDPKPVLMGVQWSRDQIGIQLGAKVYWSSHESP